MTAIEEPAPSGAKPFFFSIWGGRSETWLRFGMVLLFVVLCYAFPWRVWRASVTAILIAVLQDHANSAISLTYDTFRYHGGTFQVGLSCTALDVFFGSLPLLWRRQRSLGHNLGFFGLYFLGLSAINLVRLILGFRLYAAGVSWFVAHELMSGLFYFGIFIWIVRLRMTHE